SEEPILTDGLFAFLSPEPSGHRFTHKTHLRGHFCLLLPAFIHLHNNNLPVYAGSLYKDTEDSTSHTSVLCTRLIMSISQPVRK
ncbi:hypothetical protein ACVEWT_003854, partial [Klebsiella michiganensis]